MHDALARKPPLLLVSRKWPPAVGGMETYSVELARSLRDAFAVEELVLHGRPNGDAPGLLRYIGFVMRATAFCLRHGRRFGTVVFTDLVLFPAAVAHRLAAPRARRVVVVHGLDVVFQQRRGLLSRCYGLFLAAFRASQDAFDALVANSANTARLARAVGLHRVCVVNPALPDNALTRAAEPPGPLPAAWSMAAARVLYFGRIVPRKGALWYACNVVPRLDAGVAFFVVGKAPDAAHGAQLAACDRTHCLGRVDSPTLAHMIRTADAVVMPNIHTPDAPDVEGFGIAAIEASSLGAILLASAIDGITDAVVDGVTGTLVPAGDADAWADATSAALAMEEPRRADSRNAAAAATRDRFSSHAQGLAFAHILSRGAMDQPA